MSEPTPRGGEARFAALLTLASGALLAAALWRRGRPTQAIVVEVAPGQADALAVSGARSRERERPGPEAASPTWREPTKYIMGVLLLLSGLAILFIGRDTIPLVIMAALLALFLAPVTRFLQTRLRFPRGLAVAVPYLLVVLALVLAVLIVLPPAIHAVEEVVTTDYGKLLDDVAQGIRQARGDVGRSPALSPVVAPLLDTLAANIDRLRAGQAPPPNTNALLSSWVTRLAGALGAAAKLVTPVVGAVVSLFLVFLMSLQMMFSGEALRQWHPGLAPPRYRAELNALTANIVRTWVSFIRGQLTLMLIMGFLSTVGYLALGVPQAILLGILAGLLELIPSLGPTLAAIPAVVFALLFGSDLWGIANLPFALLVVAFCVLLQLLENQVIVPRVMGEAVSLPPLVVLIGVIVGGGAFGILGAFLATPMIATFDQLFRFIYRKIQEQPAVEAPPPEGPGLLERATGFARELGARLRWGNKR